jgi:hypothetical protein
MRDIPVLKNQVNHPAGRQFFKNTDNANGSGLPKPQWFKSSSFIVWQIFAKNFKTKQQ